MHILLQTNTRAKVINKYSTDNKQTSISNAAVNKAIYEIRIYIQVEFFN